MMLKISTLFLITVSIYACSSEKKDSRSIPIEKESDAISKWVLDGKETSDTVLIISPGGPKWSLDIEEKGKTNYRYIPNYENYCIAYVHQTQTIDNRIVQLNRVLSLKEAKREVAKNSEFLAEAISYFKDRNKTVVVIGKSFGAYIVQDYLATKTPIADKYFILSGRITMNQEMTEQQVRGFNGQFSEDGLTYLPEDETADLSEESEQELLNYQNKQMLKAGYGSNNYIEKLKDVELSKVNYFYGTKDTNIGQLTTEEVQFLESKGARVFKVDRDHSGINYAFIDKLEDGSISFQ